MMSSMMILKALSALLVSWIISMVLGFLHVRTMKGSNLSQPINPDGPEEHFKKSGTPTAGGVFFLLGITISALLFADIAHPYAYIPLVASWTFALIGMIDDAVKMTKRQSVGLKSSRKLAMQILAAALVLWLHSSVSGLQSTVVTHPWIPSVSWNIGIWYPIVFLLYMITFVNAVNISDGLDGLATGISFGPLLLLGILAALFGTGLHVEYIQSPIHDGALELLIVICAAFGGLLAFLWYNGPKAQVFMGDVGSHAIGALIAISALLMKVELTMAVASAVFLVECLSSFLQIVSIRLFGKKLFRMAPLHHHYEKKGVSESRIVNRFQITSVLTTVVAGILFMVKYR